VDLIRLTGAYLGAWCSFLAGLAGWAAWRRTWDDAKLALITISAAAAGATLALLRSAGDVRHLGPSLGVSVGAGALAVAMYRAVMPSRAESDESGAAAPS
jgi:peptidoglycan/LPS O-acetylase OafA/YrhL